MLREASMIACAPWPVPPPYEMVPSYAIGQTRMREFSRLENSSSAMPPKFIGRDADSVMRRSLAKVEREANGPPEPDSSGLPERLLDQRFERWVSAGSIMTARFSVLTIEQL